MLKKTINERVATRLIHLEEIINEQQFYFLYFLLKKLSLNHKLNLNLIFEILTFVVTNSSSEFTPSLSNLLTEQLQLELTNNECELLINYYKIYQFEKEFEKINWEILIPPLISDYPTWCKKLRYLQSIANNSTQKRSTHSYNRRRAQSNPCTPRYPLLSELITTSTSTSTNSLLNSHKSLDSKTKTLLNEQLPLIVLQLNYKDILVQISLQLHHHNHQPHQNNHNHN